MNTKPSKLINVVNFENGIGLNSQSSYAISGYLYCICIPIHLSHYFPIIIVDSEQNCPKKIFG